MIKSAAYIIFWICFFTFLSIWVIVAYTHPDSRTLAEEKCIMNNGVPIFDTWSTMKDCKIYLKK